MSIPYIHNAVVKRAYFKSYNFTIEFNDKVYHVKTIKVHPNSILSINSKIVWQIKYGKGNGVNFKTTSSQIIDLSKFQQLDNKIIVFKGKPHKILKYINESEVVDISNESEVYNIKFFSSMKDLILEEA